MSVLDARGVEIKGISGRKGTKDKMNLRGRDLCYGTFAVPQFHIAVMHQRFSHCQRETRIREGTLSSEWYSTPMTAESQRDTSYSALSVTPLRERHFVVESTVELLELAYRQAPGVLEVIKRDYWS
ncbi:hypothetical protein C8F04DRAFT_1194691 [Mycena alexandri]|uniref:Uncharacterized protein n=1 Tax=Mycena alexandri TaxID=1745969 RepID=A0AAD6S8A8_9AGAR|nr:hypothetical protein C8F04DRAFT_1194691 [Mycena alexandri]